MFKTIYRQVLICDKTREGSTYTRTKNLFESSLICTFKRGRVFMEDQRVLNPEE